MKLNNVLDKQEVIDRKVKELNTLIRDAVDYGVLVDVDTIKHNGLVKTFTTISVDFKINPRNLK